MRPDNTVTLDEDGGTFWRVIITDTEGPTGVAPVCAVQDQPDGLHDNVAYGRMTEDDVARHRLPRFDTGGVYDCCPAPDLETWSYDRASAVAAFLNANDVRICM